MNSPTTTFPLCNSRVGLKLATIALVAATVGTLGAGCASDENGLGSGISSNGGAFGGGREVIAGEECSSVTGIHNIGVFSPVDMHHSQPFPGGILDREGISLRDGLSSRIGDRPWGEELDMNTLTAAQNGQLDSSYAKMVEQIAPEKGSSYRPSYQNGFIVLYGPDLTDMFNPLPENEWRFSDGIIDSEELQICVFAEKGQGSVKSDQFVS